MVREGFFSLPAYIPPASDLPCFRLSDLSVIVPSDVIWYFFDQVSWWNAKHLSELAKGDCSRGVKRVGINTFNRFVRYISLSVEFSHADALLFSNLFNS